VVAGASARSLAASAARAGLEVHAVDLFADLDLRAIAATAASADPYPASLPNAIAALPPAAWLYTGALENHPEVIAAIARVRPLAGCGPAAVAAVRDPTLLATAVREAGLACPESRADPAGLPRDGSWLVKPRRSAGGHGIAAWHGAPSPPVQRAEGVVPRVWQRRVRGRAAAASYVFSVGRGRLIGVSRQLLGRRWCHASGFTYAGSVDLDPAGLGHGIRRQLDTLADALGRRFDLVGLVGVDLVIDRRDVVHVIEVNPRPTASMELIERATGLSLVATHLAACGLPAPPSPARWPRRGNWSKVILYAADDIVCDEAALGAIRTAAGGSLAGFPTLADIPAPPQLIPAGRPVCTLFAYADSAARSLRLLRARATAVARALAR